MFQRQAGSILLLVLLASCDDAASGPVAIDRLTPEMAVVFCEQMNRCCTDADRARLPPGFLAVLQSKDCAQDATLLELLDDEMNLARLRESVQTGRSLYDPQGARSCIDHLERLSCPDWNAALDGQAAALQAVCLDMVKGTRADGQFCDGNFAHECTSRTCQFAAGTFSCGPAPVAGERCDGSCEDVFDCGDRCAGDLLCSPDSVCAAAPPPRASGACRGP